MTRIKKALTPLIPVSIIDYAILFFAVCMAVGGYL